MNLERVFLLALCLGSLLWLAGDASAATIQVKQDGSGDADTIQGGIDMASAGDTVLVFPGDGDWNLGYHCTSQSGHPTPALEIPSNKTGLTLKGYGGDRVYVYASASCGDLYYHNYVLHVAAENVKVENFRFRNTASDYYRSGVRISGDDATLDDVGVESGYYRNCDSITITGTSGFTIRDSSWYATSYPSENAGLYGTDVSDVTFEGSNWIVPGYGLGEVGIYLKGNGTQVIGSTFELTSGSIQNYFHFESVTVTGATFNGYSALTIVDAESVDVTGNTYNMTGGTAITFQNTKNVTIHDEEITAAQTAFTITGSETENFQIYDNTFANLNYGITSTAPEVTIRNNEFSKISSYAIQQNSYYNLTVSGNTFEDCDIAVRIYSTDSFTVKDNVMSNNRIRSASGSSYGVYLSSAQYGTITGNTISQFDQAGLFYSSVNVITTTGNDIFDNGWGVLISGGDDTRLLHINGNDIYDNHNYGIYTNVHVDATGNYWGSNDGPYPYGSGNGVGPIEGDILAPLINIEGYTEESQTGQDVGGLTDRIMGSGTTLLMLAGALLVGVVGGRLWGRMAGNGYFADASPVTAAPPSPITQINSRENPLRPETQEEFEALSSGTWYVNPEDGKIHQK